MVTSVCSALRPQKKHMYVAAVTAVAAVVAVAAAAAAAPVRGWRGVDLDCVVDLNVRLREAVQ